MPVESAPWRMSAEALARAYADGSLSPVEALRSVHARLHACNPRLNAVIAVDEAAALAQARASEARWRLGAPLSLLDGVPLSVKDNIAVRGLPCTWGSQLFARHVPAADESPVARLRAAGAVLLGKTNVPEFTLQGYTDNALHGTTRNPWDTSLTPGGSSGGAVAAVAAGIGPLALATDGGGSIRRPCAYAGLVGLKPGRGVVPRADGLPELLPGLEEIGPVARTMADLARILLVIAPQMHGTSFPPPLTRPLRLAYWRSVGASPVDPLILARTDEVAQQWQAMGCTVVEQASPPEVEQFNQLAWPVIAGAGLAAVIDGLAPASEQALTPALAQMLAQGRARSAVELHQAHAHRRALAAALERVFTDHDVLLSPACAAMPWPAGESHPGQIAGQPVDGRGHAVFTAFVNGAGLPALALPCRPSDEGLPIGFQLVGPAGSDALLCALGQAWEDAAGPAWRWPELQEDAFA